MTRTEIDIIAVGKLKENYLRSAQDSLLKGLNHRAGISVIEIKDEKTKEGASLKELERVKNLEGKSILKHLDARARIIAMDLRGKKTNSDALKKMLAVEQMDGQKIQFIIGGSLGISEEVLAMAHRRISFGDMTYPHQLFRVMLLEELTKLI
ncbi:23S rRNA (pseudouridine(1915)-N(3))-methyltransferase RlmH [Proteiniclasticum sp. SCR006]|uniref:23S rRNA (Pseudouridine(1915)-N(3))-methyltransferase RlmH n=1 Tax=Proteiniclasticum aestuarii TaxID=2817862 RepID=A0A939HCT0_9CLOT|nr:23S rRNA (pseudouridine(1915)-N(3))-methyltransferase RlmH [Proteiniclasticum aestuarii]MBO1265612.1 23S rRNA (pseudouridine(1915)-N(3))-methyltransferase RlmH [Proteiniclasticum aestuarii]